jgi:hypothetical protein
VLVQDGHSRGEQLLYELLWKLSRETDSDEYRLLQIGHSDLAEKARMTDKNLRIALRRLVEKRSIEEMQSFDARQRKARIWKVYSYRSILDRRRKAGLEWVVKDNGVHFVRPETTPVVWETTPVVSTPDVLQTTPAMATADVSRSSPVGTTETTPVASTRPSLEKYSLREGKPTSSIVAAALVKYLGHSDDDAVFRIESRVREKCPDATEEEIVHFIEEQGPRFMRMKSLDNPMGMLIRHLPKCFEGESFRLYREEREAEKWRMEAAAAQIAEDRKRWQQVLDDPNQPEDEKAWARVMLGQE